MGKNDRFPRLITLINGFAVLLPISFVDKYKENVCFTQNKVLLLHCFKTIAKKNENNRKQHYRKEEPGGL